MLEQVFQMCEKLTTKKKNKILLILILGTAYVIFYVVFLSRWVPPQQIWCQSDKILEL